MRHGSDIIIVDTSCLIILGKIGEFGLLGKFGKKVHVTPIIQKEYGKKLPNWIFITKPGNIHYMQILEMDLDEGEASAIALSLELNNPILIIDDLKGRKIAAKLRLKYSGTFGLILKAKQLGIIESVKPIIDKITNTNFRFSKELLERIINKAEED